MIISGMFVSTIGMAPDSRSNEITGASSLAFTPFLASSPPSKARPSMPILSLQENGIPRRG